jgi:hypothetical protein
MKNLLGILLVFLIAGEIFPQITIDTSFEGANARVLNINNSENSIKVQSVLKRGDVHNVILFFKAKNINISQNFKISIFINQTYYLPIYAAYSYDKINWYRFSGTINGSYKEFVKQYSQDSLYFCYGYPYTYTDLINYCNGLQNNPLVTISNVSVSELGRNVKLLKITNNAYPDSGKQLIWVLGRNHAMETHSNYVVEGLINFLISNDIKAVRLRNQAIIYLVPIMDVDMAALGGTGKDQIPVDFNRDWDSPSYWNAVNGVKNKIIQTSAQNRLRIFLDSHDPFPGDDTSSRFMCYSLHESGIKSINLNNFRTYFVANSNYYIGRQPLYPTAGQPSTRWVDSVFSYIDISISFETGWTNRPDGVFWTQSLYRLNGEYVGKAVSDYIFATTAVLNNTEEISLGSVLYPNPTNNSLLHKFKLQSLSDCRIEFYDVLGKKLYEEDYGFLTAGEYFRNINLSKLPSGIYYAKFLSDGIRINKIVIIK